MLSARNACVWPAKTHMSTVFSVCACASASAVLWHVPGTAALSFCRSQNREKAFCHMLVEGGKMGFGGRRDCDNRFVCRKCLLFAAKTRTLCHPLLCLPARPFAGDDGAYAGASAG